MKLKLFFTLALALAISGEAHSNSHCFDNKGRHAGIIADIRNKLNPAFVDISTFRVLSYDKGTIVDDLKDEDVAGVVVIRYTVQTGFGKPYNDFAVALYGDDFCGFYLFMRL